MTQRFFPTYSYGTPPPRAQQRIGTGGSTEYKGSASDGGGSVRISVEDSPYDSYTAYGQLAFSTGHADEIISARQRTYQTSGPTYGQYGQFEINPPSFLDDGFRNAFFAREYKDTGAPTYSRLFSANGIYDLNSDNPWESITYWQRDSNVGGHIASYAGNYFWFDNADTGSITTLMSLNSSGNLAVTGNLSKGTGTFDIDHPVLEGKRLRHSFIEGPQADLIYRGTVTLGATPTTISMDTEFGMAEGTWEALNCTPWSMAAASGEVVEWSFEGNTLTITGDEDTVCNWMVIGERHDPHMIEVDCADEHGRIVLEYDQPEPVEHIWE